MGFFVLIIIRFGSSSIWQIARHNLVFNFLRKIYSLVGHLEKLIVVKVHCGELGLEEDMDLSYDRLRYDGISLFMYPR